MSVQIITASQLASEVGVRHVAGAKEAAQYLGKSQSWVRLISKRLGVKRIDGRTVAGAVLFGSHPLKVAMTFAE